MVDLSIAKHGKITFRSGESFWCPIIEQVYQDYYNVRFEHAWYALYKKDGTQVRSGMIIDRNNNVLEVCVNHERDIIKFEDVPLGKNNKTSIVP